MCSTSGGDAAPDGSTRPGRAALDRLGTAIEELAAGAQDPDAGTRDVAARLARLWEMVADLDPELAQRLAGYRG